MADNTTSLHKYAMQFGTYMGIYWVVKFVFFPLGLTNPFLLFLFLGLTLGVPFMGYYYAKMFRNKVCGGGISFLQASMFLIFMYMFAALLTAVAHYIYFRFIDNGYIIDTYLGMLEVYMGVDMPGFEVYIDQIKDTLEQVRSMSAIQITMQLFTSNVLNCTILALITALFVMKKKEPIQPK